jgi:phosphatidylglycerophosphate synthase
MTDAERPQPYRDATRVLQSVLAPMEKRTLIWLARRMPDAVNSDHLTLVALAAMLGAGLSFAVAPVWPAGLALVVVCLAGNWFGDSLDGTLARVRDQQRPRYGYYVDHVVDAFGMLFLFGGMALSGYMSPLVAAGLLVAYFMVSIEVYLSAHTLGEFTITSFMMGPTELRIVLSIGTLALYWQPTSTIAGRTFLLFDVGGVAAIAGLMIVLVRSAVVHTRALYRQEPIPRRKP